MHQSSGNVGLVHPVVEHGGNPAIVALEVCERHARAACGVRCCGACISLRLLGIIGEHASFSLVDRGSQKAVHANQDSLDDGICWPGMVSGTAMYEDEWEFSVSRGQAVGLKSRSPSLLHTSRAQIRAPLCPG